MELSFFAGFCHRLLHFPLQDCPGCSRIFRAAGRKCLSLSSAITESSLFFSWLFRVDFTNDSGGNAADDRIVRHVFGNHRPCRDDGVVADGHALQYGGIRTDPDILAQHDRCRISMGTLCRRKTVIERCEDHIMPDLASVSYRNSAVILKMAKFWL